MVPVGNQSSFEFGPSSLTEAVYESVRRRIVNGHIEPGEKLTENRIATDYNVARPTAKACIERLVALGLLRRSAHKTAAVPKLDETEIRDLFFSREMVEVTAVSVLATEGRVPPAARRAQVAIDNAARARMFEDQVEADVAFHTALVDAVGSRRLSLMHQIIIGEVQISMGHSEAHRTIDPRIVAREHADILDAIENGDEELAKQCLSNHLIQARDRLVAL